VSAARKVHLRIRRRRDPSSAPYWEEFRVPYRAAMNVISCLQEIQRDPVTADGKKTTPVVWDSACLEEVCGACTMIVNGRVRQSCSTLVDQVAEPIVLEPMTKFPTVRDLVVDRARLFRDLTRARAWIDLDGTYDLGPGPRYAPEVQKTRYDLSRCFACGSCLEVCPSYGAQSKFVGAAVVSQVRLMNLHPSGQMHSAARLEVMMGEGGVGDCGQAQNCVRACPKEIPLTTSIADVLRQTTRHGLALWLRR
jgi:succinate dehydrogenase / fumarate reductase iron-sulfur subunit